MYTREGDLTFGKDPQTHPGRVKTQAGPRPLPSATLHCPTPSAAATTCY